MKIIIGSDNIGFGLKEYIKEVLRENSVEYVDAGVFDVTPMDYPDIAVIVAKEVIEGKFDRGILICGTGIGMAIAANKVKGIRAAVCHDIYSAERSRKSNNAQIMALGAQIVGNALAKSLIEVWLKSEFQGGGSTKKIEKISLIEQQQ